MPINCPEVVNDKDCSSVGINACLINGAQNTANERAYNTMDMGMVMQINKRKEKKSLEDSFLS